MLIMLIIVLLLAANIWVAIMRRKEKKDQNETGCSSALVVAIIVLSRVARMFDHNSLVYTDLYCHYRTFDRGLPGRRDDTMADRQAASRMVRLRCDGRRRLSRLHKI